MPYSLSTHYAGQSLLDGFSFFDGKDPSNGLVDYQSREDAQATGLVSIDEFNRVRLGVDPVNKYSPTGGEGRPSVRLTSDAAFNHGLFIADFAHMPASTCGTWPAFWAFNAWDGGINYPAGGEIDIIEGANTAGRNLISAHTEAGCKLSGSGFTGLVESTDYGPSDLNIGCSYASPIFDTTAYGDAFNAEGGGVYALEWDDEDLRVWHFPRSAIPDDIVYAGILSPDPKTWGPPQAVFGGSACDADTYFYNLSLVININFCGDYAGNVWGKADQCNLVAPTCEEWVGANPDSFMGAYWNINYIDVYSMVPILDPGIGNGTLPNNTAPPLFPNGTASATSSPSAVVPTEAPGEAPGGTRTVTLSVVPTTFPAPKPTESDGSSTNPATINGYTLLGCFGSRGGYQTFMQMSTSPTMNNEVCVASCGGFKYAGVYDETCYCAANLGDASAVENDECDVPYPGNRFEFCGGLVDDSGPITPGNGLVSNSTGLFNGTLPLADNNDGTARRSQRYHHRRAAPPNVLLTVYGNLLVEPLPAPAPGMGGGDDEKTVTRVVTTALTEDCGCKTTTPPYGAGNMTVPVYALGNATAPAASAVPMCTVTEACDACGLGGASVVTLTVPEAVVTGGPRGRGHGDRDADRGARGRSGQPDQELQRRG
ncbi:hypothetical protein DL764_008206 [Monosporascus ibericus]|uniref:GH16 domain-containing protein n=1 Tax=Monosporascus ibericus TaxID=155417 RepID=A0A4Q4SY50_9PEZI|nr:hypothetical protein DL764_008206 [Monosporascus ibericus]